MAETASFAASERPATIERMANTAYDVVVVGGGITGCGVALDAASRGMKVALIERNDLASGTSSKSSKMVHGGLRYLQDGDVRLVYEALAERQRALRNAPHLVREVDFLIPIADRAKKFKRMITAALWAYDVTGGYRIGKLHKKIGAAEAQAQMPTMPPGRVDGGFYYPDARADDARLTMYLARTATIGFRADIATYVAAVGVEKDAAGKVRAVACRDTLDGTEFEIAAGFVVNASGVWTDDVRSLDEGTHPGAIRQAKGIHLVVDRAKLRNRRAMGLGTPDGRPFFIMPWDNRAYIGTTDTDYDGPLADPQATPGDIEYLLEAANFWLEDPLDSSDIIATWAGIRPLVKSGGSKKTTDMSRKHKLIPGSDGFVTITGGKLTTYRLMAEDTIDYVIERTLLPGQKTLTRKLPLDGAVGFEQMARDPKRFGVDADPVTTRHLLGRHGTNAAAVVEIVNEDESLAQRLVDDLPYLRAEVVHAARAEGAQRVADVVERRTRLSLEDRSRGLDAAEEIAGILAAELGWDDTRRDQEIENCRLRTDATLGAEKLTTPADAIKATGSFQGGPK